MLWKGNLAIFGSSNISETREVTPAKIGLHASQINLYLHEFFELILFFDPHGLKGSFGHFEGKRKSGKISKTGEAMPTKIGLHAFQVNLYLPKFLSRLYFLFPFPLCAFDYGCVLQVK